MKRLGWLLVVPIFCALLYAQAPVPTSRVPDSRQEGTNVFYLGYARTFTDFGDKYDFNGFDTSITRYVSRRAAAVAEFEFHVNSPYTAYYYGYRIGGRYDFLPGQIRPFGQFLIGGAHMTGDVGEPHELVQWNWTGFSWAGGGGVDMYVSRGWGVRVELNHQRVPFGTHGEERADWNRLSGGLTFRW